MADYTGGNLDMLNVGSRGGLGGGIWDIIALGLVTGGGILGDKRNDCCAPATCEQVADCDKDVLKTANEIQSDICASTHAIEKDLTSGFYALNDKIGALAYSQQALAKDTQTLIVSKFAEQESKAQSAIICAQNEEINRYKTVEMLKACGHGQGNE